MSDAMIKTFTLASVTLLTLEDHPGGSDGGTFPQEHTFGLGRDCPFYSTDLPSSPNDAFDGEDIENYTLASTRQDAIAVLQEQLAIAKSSVEILERLTAEFIKAKDFEVVLDLGDDDEDDDDEDD